MAAVALIWHLAWEHAYADGAALKRQKKKKKKKGRERKKDPKQQSRTINKLATNTYLSIITLTINGLSIPTKRKRLAIWMQKQNPYICCLQETHFSPKNTDSLKVRGWKKILHANGNQIK